MSTYEIIIKRRSIRRFKQERINKQILFDCINAARLAPSAANLQPLEYILVTKNLDKIFGYIKWARYLNNGIPKPDERPVAYVVMISDTKISQEAKCDVGLAAENIVLTVSEKGIASCIIGSANKNKLAEILKIPQNYLIELVIALGYPKQESFIEEFKENVKYWLDKNGNLHVPKRKLKDIFHEEKF